MGAVAIRFLEAGKEKLKELAAVRQALMKK
jgi:hypothetical protein